MPFDLRLNPSTGVQESRWVDDAYDPSGVVGVNTTLLNSISLPSYTTYPITPPYVPSPKEVEITAIRARMTAINLPDITINGHQISLIVQDYARECVDKLRAETAARFVQYEQTIMKYREAMIMINPHSTDPISGRKFREPGE